MSMRVSVIHPRTHSGREKSIHARAGGEPVLPVVWKPVETGYARVGARAGT